MSIKKLRKLLSKLNEASLEQTLKRINRDKIIKDAIDHNESSMGNFNTHYVYELSPSDVSEIESELSNGESDNMTNSNDLIEEYGRDEVISSKAFKNFVYSQMESKLDDVISELQYHIRWNSKNNKIELFRVMEPRGGTSIEEYLTHLEKQGKHLGIYWADSYEKAQDFGDAYLGREEAFIIKISVDDKHINWEDTISLRMSIELGEEQEIRLFKNTAITIDTVYDYSSDSDITGEELDISEIKGKTFYA